MALTLLSSCRDKEDDPTPEEKKGMLIGKEWIEIAVVKRNGEVLPVTSWRKSSIFLFYADNTYREIHVAPDGIATPYSGTWELNKEATQLTLKMFTTEVWHIKELKNNSLKVKYTAAPLGGISNEIEASLTPLK